ncbi:CsbD family protein [Anaeromyxobacter oryzisoli]|uniref:CsbD family protein n=1 Tax=Anaeromyxobacter oryzisoli TaxID=2925408 RepID=UPI001F58E09E|nr:CsbD family protein [Anaeromyxobacter sp. SG63]
MKPSTKDQAKGKFGNLKGKIKEAVGIITGQRKLEAEGKDQKLAGKAREKLGQVKKVLGK